MSRPTLQQLSYLVAVADEGNFRRAAQSCFVSQPALSTQIKELERRLGTTLIERTVRGAVLTPSGRIAADDARRVLQLVDDLTAAVDADGDDLSGDVQLGVIPTLAPYLLPKVVPVLTGRHPRAELRVRELRTDVLLDELANGALDLGLIATRETPAGIVHQPLAPDPFLLATSASDELAHGSGPVGVDVLARRPVLLLEEGHCLRDQAQSVCDLVDAATRTVYDTSLSTLVQMVAAGQGITLLPTSAAAVEARPGNGIVTRLFDAPAPSRTIALVWRASSPRAAHYRELADLLGAALRTGGPAVDPPGREAPGGSRTGQAARSKASTSKSSPASGPSPTR
jgi:LysR family hydrogen peroxide-inducible transcriptional activator